MSVSGGSVPAKQRIPPVKITAVSGGRRGRVINRVENG